jgi:hypothetical protein
VNERQQANQLLDRHKETKELSYLDTTRALAITGDYEELGSERVDNEIQEEVSRSWDAGRFWMVVADIARYREKTRLTSNQ